MVMPMLSDVFTRPRAIAALSACVLAGSIVCLALLGGGRPSTAEAGSSYASYSVLTSDKPAAATATDVRPALDRIAQGQPEILGSSSRLIGSTPSGKVVVFISSNDDLCIALASYFGSGETSCKPQAKANVSGVAFGGPVHRFGVVPDGVDSVAFRLSSGTRQAVKVIDNYYTAPAEAVTGTYVLGGVTQSQEFVPRSAVPAIGESVTDARGATTRVEPDGTVSLSGPGVKLPE
jgi:hypothetical protein